MTQTLSVSSTLPATRTKLIGLLDGTDPPFEGNAIVQLKELERAKAALGDRLDAVAVLHRSGMTTGAKLLKGILGLGVSLTAGAVGGLFGTLVGPITGILGAGAGVVLTSGYLQQGFQGFGGCVSAFLQNRTIHEPAWGGQRIYNIAPDKSKKLDSIRLQQESDSFLLDAEILGAWIGQNLEPNRMNVLYYYGGSRFGHDNPYGGPPLSLLRKAMNAAGETTEQKFDLAFLDWGFSATVEAMIELSNVAHIALALRGVRNKLEIQDVIKLIADRGSVQEAMSEKAKEEPAAIRAYNLSRIKLLTTGLDQLGSILFEQASDPLKKRVLQKMLQQSARSSLFARIFKYGDLGQFLIDASTLKWLYELDDTVTRASVALHSVQIPNGVDDQSNSIWFQLPNGRLTQEIVFPKMIPLDRQQYNDLHLPNNWKKFIQFVSPGMSPDFLFLNQ